MVLIMISGENEIYEVLRKFMSVVRNNGNKDSIIRISVDTLSLLEYISCKENNDNMSKYIDMMSKLIKIIIISGSKSDGTFEPRPETLDMMEIQSTREAIKDGIEYGVGEIKDEVDKTFMGFLAINIIDKIGTAYYKDIYFIHDYLETSEKNASLEDIGNMITLMLKTLNTDELIYNSLVQAGSLNSDIPNDIKKSLMSKINDILLMASNAAIDSIYSNVRDLRI